MPGPLGLHGCSTTTLLLGAGSWAIDTGDDAVCAAAPVDELEQRGMVRPYAAHCDTGAVEKWPDPLFANGFE
ncbi:MAG: choice-of-anchor Q domain-containing protein [Rhodanobacteraceae bacterium]